MPIVPFLRWPFWPVSMLYAGIYLNVGLFEFTYYFGKLAIHPALVAFSAALFSVFLFVGVAYVPAVFGAEEGGGTLADLSNLFLGRWPTYILKYGLYAAWLVSWLLSSAFYAARYLRLGLVRQDGFSLITELIITLLWLAVIAPASGGTAVQFARSSSFIMKISAVSFVALAISAEPRTVVPLDWLDARGLTSLFEPFLLWGSPALLLIGYFTRQSSPKPRDIRFIGLAGIVIPLVIGLTCGLLTATGWAAVINGGQPSSYFFYVGRSYTLTQGKVLVVAFTLLTAGRFAAFNLAQLIPPKRRLLQSWLMLGIVLLGSCVLSHFSEYFQQVTQSAWSAVAVPFFPLAGVLSAAYLFMRRRPGAIYSIDQTAQRWLLAAWLIGVALTCLPTQFPEVPIDPSFYFRADEWRYDTGLPRFWLIQGWIASFAISWIALTLRQGPTAGVEEAAPETTPR